MNVDLPAGTYALFDTAWGTCGLAWTGRGVTRLQLPERDRLATEERLAAGGAMSCRGLKPAHVEQAAAALQHYFSGQHVDFGTIVLDLSRTSAFHQKVYDATRRLGWGNTASYGSLARCLGLPDAARAVARAMARNPVPIIIPCHRVIASSGKPGGFSAYGGVLMKQRLLAMEGTSPHPPGGSQLVLPLDRGG